MIERGLPGPGLLAHVVVSKYQDHCPLHRLRRIYLRDGVDLAVSTLAGWVEAGHDALHPLAERIRALAHTAYLVQADDTGLKVLDKDSPGGSKRGHLWCYVGDEKLVAIVLPMSPVYLSPMSPVRTVFDPPPRAPACARLAYATCSGGTRGGVTSQPAAV